MELRLHGHGAFRQGDGEHRVVLGSGAQQPDRSGIDTSSGAVQGRLDVEPYLVPAPSMRCCLASAKTTGSVALFRSVRSSTQA